MRINSVCVCLCVGGCAHACAFELCIRVKEIAACVGAVLSCHGMVKCMCLFVCFCVYVHPDEKFMLGNWL